MASLPLDWPSNVHSSFEVSVYAHSLSGTMLDSCRLSENISNRAMAAPLLIQSIVVGSACHIIDI